MKLESWSSSALSAQGQSVPRSPPTPASAVRLARNLWPNPPTLFRRHTQARKRDRHYDDHHQGPRQPSREQNPGKRNMISRAIDQGRIFGLNSLECGPHHKASATETGMRSATDFAPSSLRQSLPVGLASVNESEIIWQIIAIGRNGTSPVAARPRDQKFPAVILEHLASFRSAGRALALKIFNEPPLLGRRC